MTITRFAPSPTGHLHIGGARTALFCWAWAKRNAGSFLLRIEDTDQARSTEAATRGILEDLAWLSIDWDEGPEFTIPGGPARRAGSLGGDPRSVGPFEQSNRLDIYKEHIERLIAEGKAYPAFETSEELALQRKAAEAEKKTYRYDRAALQLAEAERAERIAKGEPHVVRFLVPDDEPLVVSDAVLGEVKFGAGEVEDFVIRKADGYPTYHLAVVVDDALMGVTHVLRGQEHLTNTPKHVVLQNALGFTPPVYAHMPLIFNERGAKMSKRERDVAARQACQAAGLNETPCADQLAQQPFAAWLEDKKRQLEPAQIQAMAQALGLDLPEVSVEDFRAAGYLPEVVCNFIALLGWTPPKAADGSDVEKFTLDDLARHFDIADIGKSNARFDRTKLGSFNADAIGAMDPAHLLALWREWAARYDAALDAKLADMNEPTRLTLVAAAQPRAKTLRELAGPVRFALITNTDIAFEEKAVKKALHRGEPTGLDVLREARPAIEAIDPWEPEAIEAAVKAYGESKDLGMGRIAQPLRVALTGGMVSPGLGETLALVGKDATLKRIDRCLAECAP